MNSTEHVAVVGAGVVGLCCALFLQREGFRVTLIDRDEPGRACSYGNSGILTATERGPIGLPGTMWRVPKWLMDPLGPMVVRPSHLPRMAKWGLRLLRESRPANVERIADDMETFFSSSVDLYRELLTSIGAANLLRTSGYLCVYYSRETARQDDYFWDLHARRGVRLERLSSEEMRRLVPGLSQRITHGVFVPEEGSVTDPYVISLAIVDEFSAHGGKLMREEVRRVEPGESSVRVIGANDDIKADSVVIAAGVWSKRIAENLGSKVLLDSMRGYHAMIAAPGIDVPLPMLSGDHKFFASPMDNGLRLAGTAEFAGLDAPPDFRRAHKLVDAARRIFPELDTPDVETWMGHRPMTPDSLPVVSPSPHHRNVFFAFGHGHNGLSGAPMTGRIIAELAAGRATSINIAPYSIERF